MTKLIVDLFITEDSIGVASVVLGDSKAMK